MSKEYKTVFGSSDDVSSSIIEIAPIEDMSATDPFSNIFTPVSDLLGASSSAARLSGATINLSAIENWPALINSVDVNDLTETLVSSTKYVIADPKSGIKVVFQGTDLTTTQEFGYTVLATGTVTGFNVKLNGVSIAQGAGYSLSASTVLNYALLAVEENSAKPLFDMWFSIPTTISGTAAVIKASLSLLEPYVDITGVAITDGPLVVSVAKFNTYQTILDKVTGGFTVQDTVADIKAAINVTSSPLVADTNVKSVVLLDGSTSTLKLKASAATADSSFLAKISGDAIIAVQQTNSDWATTGQGDGLTIHDIVGVDAIVAKGSSETFSFGADWGTASIKGLATHATGAGHDSVTLAASEFAQGALTLLADAKENTSGTAVIVTAGADTLTLTGFTTKADFRTAVSAGDFTFV